MEPHLAKSSYDRHFSYITKLGKKKLEKPAANKFVRSSFVSFPFSFVSLSSSLVSPSLTHSLFTPSAAAPPPHPLHSIYLGSNSKFTFIRRMKKSKLLMMKNSSHSFSE
jgi:hypothetical protein